MAITKAQLIKMLESAPDDATITFASGFCLSWIKSVSVGFAFENKPVIALWDSLKPNMGEVIPAPSSLLTSEEEK